MKSLIIRVILFSSLVVSTGYYVIQETSSPGSIQLLLNNNGVVSFPVTSGKMISLLGKYSELDYQYLKDDPSGWGNRYIWKFSNGLSVIAQTASFSKAPDDKDDVEAVFLSSKGKVVDSLIYGLALNKTTKNECRKLFGSQLHKTIWLNDSYCVYKYNLYTYLTFDAKERLTDISQVTFDLEKAD